MNPSLDINYDCIGKWLIKYNRKASNKVGPDEATLEYHRHLLTDGLSHNRVNVWNKNSFRDALKLWDRENHNVLRGLKAPTIFDDQAQLLCLMFQDLNDRKRNRGTGIRTERWLKVMLDAIDSGGSVLDGSDDDDDDKNSAQSGARGASSAIVRWIPSPHRGMPMTPMSRSNIDNHQQYPLRITRPLIRMPTNESEQSHATSPYPVSPKALTVATAMRHGSHRYARNDSRDQQDDHQSVQRGDVNSERDDREAHTGDQRAEGGDRNVHIENIYWDPRGGIDGSGAFHALYTIDGGDQDEADATNHWPDHSSGFMAAKFHWGTENTKTSIIDYENGHFDHAVLRSDDVRKKKRSKNGVRSGGGGPVSRGARGRAQGSRGDGPVSRGRGRGASRGPGGPVRAGGSTDREKAYSVAYHHIKRTILKRPASASEPAKRGTPKFGGWLREQCRKAGQHAVKDM